MVLGYVMLRREPTGTRRSGLGYTAGGSSIALAAGIITGGEEFGALAFPVGVALFAVGTAVFLYGAMVALDGELVRPERI